MTMETTTCLIPRQRDALILLRHEHREYLRSHGGKFGDRLFKSTRVPGWAYLPASDKVVPAGFTELLW